jgi:asparagine synthase (glutamine-hydrolysing)
MGFAVPVRSWLRTDLRALLHEHVLAGTRGHGRFDTAVAERWYREHQSGRRDRSTELWGLLLFNLWHRRFVESGPVNVRAGGTAEDSGKPRPPC